MGTYKKKTYNQSDQHVTEVKVEQQLLKLHYNRYRGTKKSTSTKIAQRFLLQ